MSGKAKLFAVLNLMIDALLILFLLGMIWVAARRDPYAYVFWVPFLLFVVVMRARQAGTRWAPPRKH